VQWLAKVCIDRPVFALMLIAAVVVAGLASYPQLGIDRFPNIDLPTVIVRTTYTGSAAAEMESEVTQVMEEAVSTVAGIDELRSITADGSAFLLVSFNLNRNIDAATQDVRDAIGSVLKRLPPDLDPPVVEKRGVDDSPIMSLAVFGPRSPRELYYLADRSVKNVIESAAGVGEVVINGTSDRAIQINIEASQLASHRLSITQVHDALLAQNAEVPGGRVDAGFRELSLRTLGRMTDPREFENLVVTTVEGVPIRIGDLGNAVDLQKEIRTVAQYDGKEAVVLEIQRQSGTNTVEVIEGIKQKLDQVQALLPPDVKVSILQDQSRYIHAAMHEVKNHLVSGSIMASLVVLLFMRSWRSTVIASIAIPTSIIGTFAVMRAMDFTLNNVTMLGLVLMVGVVIDDAIVVLENVFRYIEEEKLPPREATIHGTKEIGLAVLATTISLVIVFLPVSFLSSVTGRLLFQFGITATAAIMISMLVSFSLTPMMCSRMLKPAKESGEVAAASRRGFYSWIESGYMLSLRLAMRHRWLMIALCGVVIASNVPLFGIVQRDYIPTNVDESEFEVRVTAPEGTSPSSMAKAVKTVEDDLLKIHGIAHLLSTVGSSGLRGGNSATLYVRLQDSTERTFSFGRLWHETLRGQPLAVWQGNFSQREKMQEVRQVFKRYPNLRASVRNIASFRQGAPVDLDYTITGPNLEALGEFSVKLRERVRKIPGIVDVDSTLRFDKPDLLVSIDRERAAAMGVEMREIAETLRLAVGGDDRVSRYYDDQADDSYDIELRLVGVDRADPATISQLYVRASSPRSTKMNDMPLISGLGYGETLAPLVRLDNLVTFNESRSAARIDRLDHRRMVAIRANITEGYSLSDRIEAVRQATQELGLPPGFDARVLGGGRELERTISDFGWTFLLSFVFMYIVIAAQYEHLVHPLTILITLPLAVPFGLVSIYLWGESLNLYSALGILVLFGVVKKAAILQVDHMNQLRDRGMPREEAILQANRDRLRPILMTTISFVAGMFPLLIATGPGAEERRSIAVLVVGGQSLSLLLTLLAVPVIYSLLDDFSLMFQKNPARPQPQAAESPEPVLVSN
jgi:HAE1 family hydrophobic/amphiphilic exporter-1